MRVQRFLAIIAMFVFGVSGPGAAVAWNDGSGNLQAGAATSLVNPAGEAQDVSRLGKMSIRAAAQKSLSGDSVAILLYVQGPGLFTVQEKIAGSWQTVKEGIDYSGSGGLPAGKIAQGEESKTLRVLKVINGRYTAITDEVTLSRSDAAGPSGLAGPEVAEAPVFDPGNIIDDAAFSDVGTMSEQQIQSFLEEQGSYLAGYYEAADVFIGPNDDVPANGWRASHIIWQVANWYGINPQVIIATLQKEQSLITDPNPESWQLDYAMGYGCPDDAPCQYPGFARQVDMGTWQLNYNMHYANLRDSRVAPYLTGDTVTIDDTAVYLSNGATASLYRYTPHLHGNQLFHTIFHQWFTIIPAGIEYYSTWYDQSTAGMTNWVMLANPSAANTASAYLVMGGIYRGNVDIVPDDTETPVFPGVMGGPVRLVSAGENNLLASHRVLYNGNFTETPFVGEADLTNDYYLPWYDEATTGMRSWIMVGNQGSEAATVEIYIHGRLQTAITISPGDIETPDFPGVMDGPVRVVSTNGQQLIVSERVVYNGSFSEIAAIPAESVGSDYYFTWYDSQTPGLTTWVLLANPGISEVNAEIYIGDVPMGSYMVAPGGVETPVFTGVMDGPVRVVATNGQPLIVTERSLYFNSFEEVAGVQPGDIANPSWFTWYDQLTPGLRTWVLMANVGSTEATAQIYVGGAPRGDSITLAPGDILTPSFPGVIGGPVKVVSIGGQVLVSERTIYNASFNEITGMAP